MTVRLDAMHTPLPGESERAFANRVHQLANQLVTLLHAYGGEVHTLRADHVHALFGIPDAVEDDAARAVRAAFAIRTLVESAGGACAIALGSGELMRAPLTSLQHAQAGAGRGR